MRAATVVQVLQDLYFIACFILLVIAPLCITKVHGTSAPAVSGRPHLRSPSHTDTARRPKYTHRNQRKIACELCVVNHRLC